MTHTNALFLTYYNSVKIRKLLEFFFNFSLELHNTDAKYLCSLVVFCNSDVRNLISGEEDHLRFLPYVCFDYLVSKKKKRERTIDV